MLTAYTVPTAASGTNWTNPTNVYSSDNSRATYANAGQDDLKITGFGFSIPTGATILGIEVLIEGNGSSSTASNRSIQIGATKDGSSLAGSRLASQNLPQTTDGNLTFGSGTNLFSTTFSPADINASTFGILLRAGNTNTSTRSIDQVQVRIYYSPLISALTDDFNDNSLDATKWATSLTSSATVAESSGKIIITPANSTVGSKGILFAQSNYNMTNGWCLVEVPQAADTTNVYTELNLQIDANNYVAMSISAGNLQAYKVVGAAFTSLATTAYNSTNHRWWRIRESGGQTYWDYSADGKTWINFYHEANSITMTSLNPAVLANEHTSDATPGAAWFDNFGLGVSGDAIDTFSDDFNDNSIDSTKWNQYTASGGTITETSSLMQYSLQNSTLGSWAGIHSKAQYNLTGKRVFIKMPDATGGGSWLDLTLSLEQLPVVDNFFSIGVNTATGSLEAVKEVGGTDTVLASTTYNSTTHAYIALRESSGTTYFEYSSDGVSWSTLHSVSNIFPVTNLYVVLDDYENTSSTGNIHQFDEFNISPSTNVTVSATVQSVVASQPASTITAVQNITISPSVQNVTMSSQASTVSASVNISIAVSVLAAILSQPASTITTSSNATIAASVQNVTLSLPSSTVVGERNVSTSVAVQAATISQPTATISTSTNVTIAAPVKVVIVTQLAPTISTTRNITISPAVQSISLSSQASSVTIDTASIANAQSITITSISPSITANQSVAIVPSVLQVIATSLPVTVSTDGNVVVAPLSQNIAINLNASAISTVRNVTTNPAVQTIIGNFLSPTITAEVNTTVNASVQTVDFSHPAHTITTSSNVAVLPAVQSVTVSVPAMQIQTGSRVDIASQAIGITQPSPTVTAIRSVTIAVQTQIITITLSPIVQSQVLELAIGLEFEAGNVSASFDSIARDIEFETGIMGLHFEHVEKEMVFDTPSFSVELE